MRLGTLPQRPWSRKGGLLRASIVLLSALSMAAFALAEDSAIRAKLMGEWQQSDGNAKSIWTLKDKGNSIHISNAGDAQTLAEFDCNTTGTDCAIKRSGHKAKVSMWFNGTKLVELETEGNQVVKRLFTVAADGDTMELQTIPMVPSGSSETTHFKRIPSDVSKK